MPCIRRAGPSRPDSRVAIHLPRLFRRPLERQRHLIAADLQLLARGDYPFANAEGGVARAPLASTRARCQHIRRKPLNRRSEINHSRGLARTAMVSAKCRKDVGWIPDGALSVEVLGANKLAQLFESVSYLGTLLREHLDSPVTDPCAIAHIGLDLKVHAIEQTPRGYDADPDSHPLIEPQLHGPNRVTSGEVGWIRLVFGLAFGKTALVRQRLPPSCCHQRVRCTGLAPSWHAGIERPHGDGGPGTQASHSLDITILHSIVLR